MLSHVSGVLVYFDYHVYHVSGTSRVSSFLAPAALAAAADALTDVYGDGAGPESSIGDDTVAMTDDHVIILHGVLAKHCSPCPATTSLWLPALTDATGVLTVL